LEVDHVVAWDILYSAIPLKFQSQAAHTFLNIYNLKKKRTQEFIQNNQSLSSQQMSRNITSGYRGKPFNKRVIKIELEFPEN